MLEQQLQLMWKTDFSDTLSNPKAAMSIEDKKASIMESTLVNQNQRYKLSLPWRNDPSTLPNNISLARSRLSMLRKRLERDSVLQQGYTNSIQDYITKGFARKVSPEEDQEEHAWYIPHHAVINPNKPGKTRVVFDCSAKYRGVSLDRKSVV